VLIKRAVLERLGYLDEAFAPAYFEDADYGFRAREAGFRLVYSPFAEIYHYSMVTAQAVRREDDSLAAAAARNERLFRQRWAHRFY
jgi:GT2 family glycosyltransferase